jgi:hypothetical protein
MNCAMTRWPPAASLGKEVVVAATKELGRGLGRSY